MSGFTTCYAFPWALILRGGAEPGKRPFTRMAFIKEAVAEHGEIVAYRGWVGNERLGGWTKHPRHIEPATVVKTWRNQPSPDAIKRAKAKLRPAVEAAPC